MNELPKQVIENVFPEERNRVFAWVKAQKRNLRAWLFALIILSLGYLGSNFQEVFRFVSANQQATYNWVVACWLLAIVALPFIWPEKPGDTFSDAFKSGINPRVWEWEGNWKTELDEGGKPILTVTDSELGGLAIPCRAWTDYELQFDTRIIKECTGWIVRSSNLNDCAMFQLKPELFRPHIRANGIWIRADNLKHGLQIKTGIWYSVRTLVRGSWATVYITVDGKEHLVFQNRFFGTQPAVSVELRPMANQTPDAKTTQVVNISVRVGSFGFRLSGNEMAQFRNIRAYKLR